MNPWYDTDHLLTEMMGLNRNALFVIFLLGFVTWQVIENLSRAYLGPNAGFLAGVAPLAGTVAFYYYMVIPTVRRWNDRLPVGYFEGIYDFYFFNTDILEIANDPEPLLPYIPSQTGQVTRPGVNQN